MELVTGAGLMMIFVAVLYLIRNVSKPSQGAAALAQLADNLKSLQDSVLFISSEIRIREDELKSGMTGLSVSIGNIQQRVAVIESGQSIFSTSTSEISGNVKVAKSNMDALLGQVTRVNDEINKAHLDINEMKSKLNHFQATEEQAITSLRRLESTISGTKSKGEAGENILASILSVLPDGQWITNVQFGSGIVEYAFVLPNQLYIPIDSKWTATDLVEQFAIEEDHANKQKLKTKIQTEVRKRAEEVRQYIDPERTAGFGIAVIPDSVYDLCCEVRLAAFQNKVTIISYSLLVPYLLLIYNNIVVQGNSTMDMQKLTNRLNRITGSVRKIEKIVDVNLVKSINGIEKARGDLKSALNRLVVDASG